MRGFVQRHRWTLVLGTALLVAASSNSLASQAALTSPRTYGADAQHPEVGATSLNVMTFNIWLGGGLVDFAKVIEVITKSDADIVGLQEAAGHTAEIAQRLGWYAEPRMHVISRYPIIAPPAGKGAYVYVQVAPGQVVAVGNVHLPSSPYGPELVRDGESLADVLANEEETRLSALDSLLPVWKKLIANGTPLFLTGDFNAPSHRDWTAATVGALPHMKYPVQWPVSLAVEKVGFVDTFRAANPDPLVDPGRTWTYGYPYPRIRPDEVVDRIDLVYASKGSKVTGSRVVGEAGTPDVDISVTPYPSDHRAVVSTVLVDPVEPPPFVAVEEARVERGDPFGVRYRSPGGEDTDRLVVVKSGRSAANGRGIMWLPPMEASFYGQVLFGSGNLSPGAYDVVLLTKRDKEVSRSPFWVVAPDARPAVSVKKTIAQGKPITLTWNAAPAERFDWVAIYPAGELDLYNAYLAFAYTESTVQGRYTFGRADLGKAMLPPGNYIAMLASDDHYIPLSTMSFRVTKN